MSANLRVLVWPVAALAVLLLVMLALMIPAQDAHSAQPTVLVGDSATMSPSTSAPGGGDGGCC